MIIEKLDGFTADGFGHVIGTEQDLTDGDVMRIISDNGSVTEKRYSPPAPPSAPVPKTLSKTAFMDLAWAQFGGGTVGMARFSAIMNACRTGTDVLQAIHDRYDAADIFAKDQVAALTSIMVSGGAMVSGERDAILNSWPTI